MAYVNASDIDILCKGTIYDLSLFAKNQGYNFTCNVIDFENYYHYGTANKSVLNLQNVTSDMILLETASGKIELKMDGQYLINLHITDANNRHYLQRVINKSNTGATYFTIYFGIDETNQLGSIALLTWRSGSNANFNAFGDSLGNGFYNNIYAYNLIKGLVPPQYNWQSVPSISGKNGILSCARVKDDSILTGDDITNIAMDGVITPSAANFPTLFSGVPRGMRTPILYAGMVDHMDVQRTTGGPTAFNMYINVAGNDVYTWATGYFDNSYLGFIIDDENEVAKVVKINPYEQADIQVGWSMEVGPATDTEMHNIWLFIHSHTNEEDNPEINEDNPGTDPTYQPDIAVTGITKPGYGALDTGFTSMFRMSDTQLKQLSNFLWSSSFIDVVKKFFNDPREIIVGLSIMPVIPDTGSSTEVRAGGISTGVYGLPLTDQYKFDTYGYAKVKAEKGNFLDYSPFTKVTAHLPFVGEHSLDVNDVVGKTLTLKYIFDFLTGSCVAEIVVDGNPRYFFGGACGIQIPTSSEDFGRMYSSILSAGATLGGTLSTIATGGLTAPLTFGAASSMLANGMNSSPTVQFSSGSGSVNGMIGCKTAFLVIEKPIEKIVGDQQKFLGRPSFTKRTLSACSGYTKCMQVHLDDIPCTATERTEIERQLLNGVRIGTHGSDTPEYTPTTATDHGLIFLKCLSDMDVIGKKWDEEDILTIEGKLMFEQSFLSPKFIIEGTIISEYNYCYIPDFKRFYYITEQIARTGALTEIHMQVDSLQSWKTEILAADAIIERSAKDSNVNMYFSDNMYWTQANKEVKTVPFTTALDGGDELVFEIPEDNYILTIAGG